MYWEWTVRNIQNEDNLTFWKRTIRRLIAYHSPFLGWNFCIYQEPWFLPTSYILFSVVFIETRNFVLIKEIDIYTENWDKMVVIGFRKLLSMVSIFYRYWFKERMNYCIYIYIYILVSLCTTNLFVLIVSTNVFHSH